MAFIDIGPLQDLCSPLSGSIIMCLTSYHATRKYNFIIITKFTSRDIALHKFICVFEYAQWVRTPTFELGIMYMFLSIIIYLSLLHYNLQEDILYCLWLITGRLSKYRSGQFYSKYNCNYIVLEP